MTIWAMTTVWLMIAGEICYSSKEDFNGGVLTASIRAIVLYITMATLLYFLVAGLSVRNHEWAQDQMIPWLGWGSYPGYWIAEAIYNSDMWAEHLDNIRVRDLNR